MMLSRFAAKLCYLSTGFLFSSLIAFANSADQCYLPLSGVSVCPPITSLKYNKNTSEWSTDDDWKSTTSSFTKEVVTFLGAQWRGVQMGHLLCLYQGPSKDQFPVSMHRNMIIQSPALLLENLNPKGAQYLNPWVTKEKKIQTTMDCYSRNNSPCDCPWVEFQEKNLTVDEVVESIEKPAVYPPWAM